MSLKGAAWSKNTNISRIKNIGFNLSSYGSKNYIILSLLSFNFNLFCL